VSRVPNPNDTVPAAYAPRLNAPAPAALRLPEFSVGIVKSTLSNGELVSAPAPSQPGGTPATSSLASSGSILAELVPHAERVGVRPFGHAQPLLPFDQPIRMPAPKDTPGKIDSVIAGQDA
jgi:hypothetical protein